VKALNCPQCGAPAKVEETTQPIYTCPYCNRSFETGAEPEVDEPIPQIIIVAPRERPPRSSSLMGTAITGFVVVTILGSVAWGLRSSGLQLPGLPGWDGKSALECSGNESITVTGLTATLPGTAIIASGNCHVKLVDSHIKADTVIESGGNAEIRIENGSIEGEVAIDASGNSTVRIAGAKVTGKRKHRANARIDGN
jgi:hypothetical protein